ncbi:LysR substrate-binding domain-containing protein [Kitasatospora purpeofusca]|uniref:LysR substrate-binding domain-containing protein n=1 Tax=Kitasatospora purpeofusca TaxID=67352 RepID=UPI0039A48D57
MAHSRALALTAGRKGADLRDLADTEWIVGSREDGSNTLIKRACAVAGYQPRIVHAADDYNLVLRMVAHGLGVALVPQLVAQTYGPNPDVALIPVADVILTRSIHALTYPSPTPRPAIDAVLDLLKRSGSLAINPIEIVEFQLVLRPTSAPHPQQAVRSRRWGNLAAAGDRRAWRRNAAASRKRIAARPCS